MSLDVMEGSQNKYAAHDFLLLSRVKENGEYITNVYTNDIGVNVFVGELNEEKYIFNITNYFYQLLNNDSYTNDLYLLPGKSLNANRTILDKDIKLTIYYSEL